MMSEERFQEEELWLERRLAFMREVNGIMISYFSGDINKYIKNYAVFLESFCDTFEEHARHSQLNKSGGITIHRINGEAFKPEESAS